jgi:type IV pilus assembly protein PilW
MYKQKGLSLIELMISITLGLILMTGVVQMFLSSKTTFTSQQGISRVQETGRLAIDFIAQDVRMAGLTGFDSKGSDTKSTVTDHILTNAAVNSYSKGLAVLTKTAAAALSPVLGGVVAKDSTDVLYVHGAVMGGSLSLTAPTALGLIKVPIGTDEVGGCFGAVTRLNGLCVNEALVISDYIKSKVFQPTSIAVNGTSLDIAFAGAWGDPADKENDRFNLGAQVSRMARIIYYIADDAVTGRPNLYQKTDGFAAVPLLEGVANMSITFNRKNTPATYAAAVGVIGPLLSDNLNPVVSVQIELVVQSSEDGVVETPQTYVFKGANVTATDRRLYQVFRTTIALRNKLF